MIPPEDQRVILNEIHNDYLALRVEIFAKMDHTVIGAAKVNTCREDTMESTRGMEKKRRSQR